MKLASFHASGRNSYGVVVGDGIVDLGGRLGERYPTLRAAIAGGALGRLAADLEIAKPDFTLAQARLLPPITDPTRSSAPAATTARMPPKRAGRRRKTHRSFCASSTPWSRTTSRWCARRFRAISITKASWR